MTVDAVRVDGLREFMKELKQIDPALKAGISKENKAFIRPVADEARMAYMSKRTTNRGRGRGARSIRPIASAVRAQVAMGGAKTPYMLGQEFGSLRGPGKEHFPPWSGAAPGGGSGSHGWFFYPAVRRALPKLRGGYIKMLERVTGRAFPK